MANVPSSSLVALTKVAAVLRMYGQVERFAALHCSDIIIASAGPVAVCALDRKQYSVARAAGSRVSSR